MLIDSHTHVNFKEFSNETIDVINRSLDSDVWLVNVGTTYKTSQVATDLADQFEEGVYASVGIHPIHFVDDITESAVIEGHEYSFTTKKQSFNKDQFQELINTSSKIVAVGECGLDVYRLGLRTKDDVLNLQEAGFRDQIRLAKDNNLAVIVHGRGEPDKPFEIYDRIIDILEEEKVERGVVHCFGGNLEQAYRLVEMGLNIGVTGIVTFKNAQNIQDIVKAVPLEHILIETDAPYLAPDPYRGKRNEPVYVQHVAKKLAELKGLPYDKVAEETTINARRMYVI